MDPMQYRAMGSCNPGADINEILEGIKEVARGSTKEITKKTIKKSKQAAVQGSPAKARTDQNTILSSPAGPKQHARFHALDMSV